MHRALSVSSRGRSIRPTALAASVAVLVAAGVAAQAQPGTGLAAHDYAIPAQPLGATLARIATEAGEPISIDAGLVQGLSAPAVRGNLSIEEAVQRALAGSGLQLARTSSGALTLQRSVAAVSAAPAGAADDTGNYSLREVRVTGRREGETEGTGSYTTDALTIGKTAQAMREIPQSVSVLTKQRLEDQNLTDLSKAAEQIVGLTVQDAGHRVSDIYSRGFAINSVQIDGGAPMTTANYAYVSYDMTEYDRIEVLRGVTGLLNGTGNPGGAVNLVRKMPTATPQYSLSASAGTWNNYRTELDASGPLAFDGKLRGRAVVSYENRNYFTDLRSTEKPTLYGVLEADIGSNAVLTLGARDQVVHENGTPQGFPRYSNGADMRLARNTALTTPWAYQDSTSREVFAKLNWRLADRWTLRVNATRTEDKGDINLGYVAGAVNPKTLVGSRWTGSDIGFSNKQNLLDMNLSGAFDLFGRTHEVLVGADMQDVRSSWDSFVVARASGQTADLFNIGSTPFVSGDLQRGQLFRSYNPNSTKQYGAYGTLRLDVAKGTKVIVGARANKYKYDQVYSTYLNDSWVMTNNWRVASATQYSEPTKVVPFAGIVHDFSPQWAAYASYAEIFNPQAYYKTGPSPGTGLDPMHGSNAELGLKGELLDAKLNTSAALYRVVQKDRAVLDSRYPTVETLYAGTCCYLNAGKVVSQGIDMEINGEVARGVNLYAGYTFNSNHDKTSENAVFSTITPKHSFKFFASWQLPGAASAWKLGAGATINSKQYVTGTAATWNTAAQSWTGAAVPYSYTQGGYAVWNLMAQYRIDARWTLTANINNLFDKVYYRTVGTSTSGNYYGDPRNVMLTLRGKF